MVRSGITKREVAGMLGVLYNTLCSWTVDIHNSNSRLSGAAEKILEEVIENGYFFLKPKQLNICRILKQNVDLRPVNINHIWILHSARDKEIALKAYLNDIKLNFLSSKRLSCIKKRFY